MNRRRARAGVGAAVSLCVLIWLEAAFAAPPSTSVKEARRRFEEGVAAYDAGQYEASRIAFAQAYALEPIPALLINLGHAELKTARYVEGARHIAQALREAEIGLGERRAAERALESAEVHVARLKVAVNIDGASIRVDGQDIGSSPIIYVWHLEPGEHRIRGSKEGFESDEQVVGISKGQMKVVELRLAPVPKGTPITLNDTPPPAPAQTGVDDGGGRSWVPLAVGGALAVGGIAAGVYFTLDSMSKRDERDTLVGDLQQSLGMGSCAPGGVGGASCREIEQLDSDARKSQTFGIVGFAVGGAALVGSAIYFFATAGDDSGNSARMNVLPVVGTREAGLAFSGRF
jgi:hypothetical protein